MTSSKQSLLLVLKWGTLWSFEEATIIKDWPQKSLIGSSRNTTCVQNLADYLLEVHVKRIFKKTVYTKPLISTELKCMLHLHTSWSMSCHRGWRAVVEVMAAVETKPYTDTAHSLRNMCCSGQIKTHQREKGVSEGTNRVLFQWEEEDKTYDAQHLLHLNKNLKKKNSCTRQLQWSSAHDTDFC